MERTVRVRGILFNNGKLLAVKHKKDDGSAVSYWAVPGGGLDVGENIISGLHREMIEETGIPPTIGNVLFIQQFITTKSDGSNREELELFFHITNANDYPAVDLTATTHGDQEIATIEWIDPSSENVLPAFLQTYDIAGHISTNLPPYLYIDMPA